MSARAWRQGGGSRSSSFTPTLSLDTFGPAPRPPITPAAPRQSTSFPERIDVSAGATNFLDFDTGTASAFAAAGQLPAQIYETPFSMADVGTRLLTGGKVRDGQVEGGFSPLGFLEQIPGLKGAASVADTGLRMAGNFVPALINATDAKTWAAVAGLPDSTEITVELLLQRGGFFSKEETGGGLFGIGNRPKTVGELRNELFDRGFFFDEANGQELDPLAVADQVRTGTRSAHSFGFAAINDNALVDLAGRLALDPTNALFFVPGANLAKLGASGARLLSVGRLARTGQVARTAPKATQVADAVLEGQRIIPTVAGLGKVFGAYRTGSIGLSVGNFTANIAAEAGLLPFADEIADFTQAVQERRPMSGNAAFMLFSAATFPYGGIVRGTRAAAGAAKTRVLGHSDTVAFHRAYGSRKAFEEAYGGPDGVRELVDFIDVQIARDRGLITPREMAEIANIGDIAIRRKIEQKSLARHVDRLRRERAITSGERLAVFQDWHSRQGGFGGLAEARIPDTGFRNPWDPARAASRWNDWKPVRAHLKRTLDDTGEVIWGVRDDVIFIEQIEAARGLLKRSTDAQGRVDPAVIRQVLEDNPNFNLLDKGDFWARFGDPKVEGPQWGSVSRKLAGMKRQREAVHIAEYTADLSRWEATAPPEPSPLDMSRPVRDLETARAQRVAELDKRSGADPAINRAIDDALQSEGLLAPARLHAGIRRMNPETIKRVADLEAELIQINPSYRIKRAPETDVLALVPEDSAISVGLRQHRALGSWLAETGPFSPVSKFWNTLTRPIKRDELATGTRTALMQELRPLGLRTKDVDRLVSAFDQRVKESVIVTLPGAAKVRLHRDIGSLMPAQVAEITAKVLNEGRTARQGVHPAISKIERAGGMYRLLSRSSSRYFRTIETRAAKGKKGSQALMSIYDAWSDLPAASTTQRVVAKFVYPLFRFTLDPRWLALNAIEANILGLSKHGFMRAYTDMQQASQAARHFGGKVEPGLAPSLAPDAGWSLTRELETYTARSFDAQSPASVAKVLDDYGANSPVMRQLRASMRSEAAEELARAQKLFDAGDITQRQLDSSVSRAQRMQRASNDALSEMLNDKLYRFEVEGVDATVGADARAALSREDFDVLRRSGLLDRIHEVNRQAWSDVNHLYKGNPSRSTMERVANSYWLYWPISYQVKATKWLLDIMLDGSFGHNNNALLAGRYSLVLEQHTERIKNNRAYAAMYESQPSLWFVAQMMLPMAPEDIGISLSRMTRSIGSEAQSFANSWLGTEIGVFTAEKSSDDLARAIDWQTKLGPIYSFELAQRLIREAGEQRTTPSRLIRGSQPPLPAPQAPSIP